MCNIKGESLFCIQVLIELYRGLYVIFILLMFVHVDIYSKSTKIENPNRNMKKQTWGIDVYIWWEECV